MVSVLSLIIVCFFGVIGSVTISAYVATEPGFLPFTRVKLLCSLSLLLLLLLNYAALDSKCKQYSSV